MRVEAIDYVNAARQVTELFHQGEKFLSSQYYTEELECITPESHRCGRKIESYLKVLKEDTDKIIHKNYQLIYLAENAGIVKGQYWQVQKTENDRQERDITMLLILTSSNIHARYIHISEVADSRYLWIKDVRERLYHIRKSDILYLEAVHNHVIWHCQNITIEMVGLLKELENTLSDDFIRIHRGYIVNRSHVFAVERCCTKMDNGDILQIPVKKYREVKGKLICKMYIELVKEE